MSLYSFGTSCVTSVDQSKELAGHTSFLLLRRNSVSVFATIHVVSIAAEYGCGCDNAIEATCFYVCFCVCMCEQVMKCQWQVWTGTAAEWFGHRTAKYRLPVSKVSSRHLYTAMCCTYTLLCLLRYSLRSGTMYCVIHQDSGAVFKCR